LAKQERDQRRHLEIEHAAREGKGKTRREDRATTEAAPRFQGRESARAGDIQHEKGPNVTQVMPCNCLAIVHSIIYK